MKGITIFLNEKGFVGNDRHINEKDPAAKQVHDFFCEEKRVTIVELVDKYQVMVYDGKHIHSTTQLSSHAVLNYLKGIL
jgi:hypothetical protein